MFSYLQKDPLNKQNYKPVRLHSHMFKVFERFWYL